MNESDLTKIKLRGYYNQQHFRDTTVRFQALYISKSENQELKKLPSVRTETYDIVL